MNIRRACTYEVEPHLDRNALHLFTIEVVPGETMSCRQLTDRPQGTQNEPLDFPHPWTEMQAAGLCFYLAYCSHLDSNWIFALDCHHGSLKSKALERAWLRNDATTRLFMAKTAWSPSLLPLSTEGFGIRSLASCFWTILISWPLSWRRMLHQRTRTEPDGKVEHCSSRHWNHSPGLACLRFSVLKSLALPLLACLPAA